MTTIDFAVTKATLGIDAICHQSPFGNVIQAVTTIGHEVMRALFPLNANGAYVWPRSKDSHEEDAAWEGNMSMLEDKGLALYLV